MVCLKAQQLMDGRCEEIVLLFLKSRMNFWSQCICCVFELHVWENVFLHELYIDVIMDLCIIFLFQVDSLVFLA